MTAADALRNFLLPLLPSPWRIQFGRWTDGSTADKYAVIRPVGGLPAALVRRPQFTVTLIGAANQAPSIPQAAAESIVEAMRQSSGEVVFFEAGEPVYQATTDGRHVFEIAISAITN